MLKYVLSKIGFGIFSFYISYILKVRADVCRNIFRRLYLDACEMFPDKSLVECGDIASLVARNILGLLDTKIDNYEYEVSLLSNKISSDDWVLVNVANYHMITAYYFSFGNSYHLHSEKIEESISKAKCAVSSAEKLDNKSFSKLNSEVKKDKKILNKRVSVSNQAKLMEEKAKVIPQITITSTQFSVSLTLISTLFLISGFIYTKVFFYFLGVNVGDFYNIQDYLSSSIDVISSTALSAFLGLVSLLFGLNKGLNDELHNQQFNILERRRDYFLPFIFIISCIGLAISVYKTGHWPNIFLFTIVFLILLNVYFRASLWNYIKNKVSVGAACLVVILFFLDLSIRIKDNVEDVLFNSYIPIYSLKMQDKYENYSKMNYLTSNSNFVFLFDAATKKVVILPKNSVTSFESNG